MSSWRRSRPRRASTCGGPGTSPVGSATSSTGKPGQPAGREALVLGHTNQGARSSRSSSPRAPGARRRQPARGALQLPRSTRASGSRPRSAGGYELVRRPVARQRQEIKRLLKDTELVRARGQPRRIPVHLHHRAAVAQEPARQRRQRTDHRGRRRRPEPQLPHHWGYDEEGSSSHLERHLPRPGAGSEPETVAMMGCSTGSARVPGKLPLLRPVAALRRGLADRCPDGRRPDLLRAVRQPRQARHRRVRPGSVAPTCST